MTKNQVSRHFLIQRRICAQQQRTERYTGDAEYKRLGTLSLLAGIDLLTGEAIPLVSETHKSSDFIEFLKYWIKSTHCRIPSESSWITIQHTLPKRHSDFWIQCQKDGLNLYSRLNMGLG